MPRRRRARRVARARRLRQLTVLALVGFVLLAIYQFTPAADTLAAGLHDLTTTTSTSTGSSVPPSTPPTRPGKPGDQVPTEPAVSGEYGFLSRRSDGSPMSWDPCRSISYVIGAQNVPANGVQFVQGIVAEVETLTGLTFEYKGLSDSVPSSLSAVSGGDAWIGWSTPAQTPVWADFPIAAGLGGASYGSARYTSGYAMVKVDVSAPPQTSPWTATVLRHEIGHLVGLAHVSSPAEVMHPGANPTGYGPGDRRGLWELGASQGCRVADTPAGQVSADVPTPLNLTSPSAAPAAHVYFCALAQERS